MKCKSPRFDGGFLCEGGSREKGEGKREKGEGKREKGEGRREIRGVPL
jgi:hypothetical protein